MPTYDGLNDVDVFWMHLRGKYQRSSASRLWIGHCTLCPRDGGVCTRVVLMIGASVGG